MLSVSEGKLCQNDGMSSVKSIRYFYDLRWDALLCSLSLSISWYFQRCSVVMLIKSGHSTETALLSVTEALKTARAAAQSSALVLLDLSAAFDTVNHRILLSILSSMGISGNAHSWFESYLTGRSFNMSWQGQLSVPHLLTTGVPQGSVMGCTVMPMILRMLHPG